MAGLFLVVLTAKELGVLNGVCPAFPALNDVVYFVCGLVAALKLADALGALYDSCARLGGEVSPVV
jgi:hypothetical protein